MDKQDTINNGEKKVILVVDDLEINREILRVSFENECDVVEATCGREALAVLESQRVDLLITDIFMDGMDGYELIQKVRTQRCYDNLPIIAVTEHDEVIQHRVLELGADEFVCKPFVARSLRNCVSTVLFGDQIKIKIEQYQQIFNRNPIPFILYHLIPDEYGEYINYETSYLNHAASDLLCISEQDVEVNTISTFSRSRLDFLVRANDCEEKVQEIRYDRYTEKYLDITAYRESEGYVAFVMTDITSRHRAERAIAEESAYLANVQDSDLLAKCRANITQNTIDHYSAGGNVFVIEDSTKYSDAINYVAGFCATKEMAENVRRKMTTDALTQNYMSGSHESSIDYMRRMRDGTVLWVKTTVKLFEDPDTQDIMCFMYTYDIDQEKTLQLIVDHVTETEFDMLGLLYLQTDMLHCVRSSEMEEMMQCGNDVHYSASMPEYIERYIMEGMQSEINDKLSIRTVMAELQKKVVYTVSCPIQFKGNTYHKKWEYSYLDDSHEVVIFTRADVTELFEEQTRQKETLRNALLQAEQASNAKTDFLSHMSHEIRTPMNAIIGMSTLAAQCVDKPQEVAECISKVGISARFLLSLINDILDMSRIESGKVNLKNERFPFEELVGNINTIIYNQAENKGIDYDCVITSFVNQTYIGDATKLQQILINLLGNAIKFTPPGGKTQLIIHQKKAVNGKAMMCFTVNDTGIGISEDFQGEMFDPFEQADHGSTSPYQGTGLGLAICKNLINMMGGTITVNSIEGVGSEFTVTVPLGICDEDEPYYLPADIPFDKLQALIVDDDVVICENTQKILIDMGMRAEWVSSGQQALTVISQKKMRKSYYDIVLLDWKMPDMDGIETARKIRSVVGPDVTIIVITAYDWSAIEQEAKAAGVNLLVTKPLFKSTLISAFQRIYTNRAQKEEKYQKTNYDFTGKRILLVEDHILNVEVAKRLLEGKNATVDVAENGLRAIEIYAKAPDYFYDAILMDIRMPVMDGLTSARSIRQLSNVCAATVPIIAMSANAFDEDVEKSKAAGMNDHLAKPIEPQLLYAVLEKHFKGYETEL